MEDASWRLNPKQTYMGYSVVESTYVCSGINLVMGHKALLQRTSRQVDYIDRGWGEICTYVNEHRRA